MSFFLPGSAPDDGYRNIRDLEHLQDLRDFVEELWTEYRPLADTHFQREAMSHYIERFWEMYLAVSLIRRGYKVQSTGGAGPDLRISDEAAPIHIEATAPGLGEGPDAVPEPPPLVATEVPEKQILLRLRGAIEAKHNQLRRWVEEGTVKDSDPYIIALNGRRIWASRGEGNLPFVIKSVFPFGHYSVVWSTTTDQITDGFWSHRDKIKKKSGSDVNTDLFESDTYADVSAVLYAWSDCANHPESLGDEFVLVHNPKAKNPIRHGLFPFGHEFTSDGTALHRKDWNRNA